MELEKKDLRGTFTMAPMDDIHYGRGSLSRLGEILERHGIRRALLITGNTLRTNDGLMQAVSRAAGGRIAGIFSETKAHVPRSVVVRAADMAREIGADGIISFGGGSPNDTAKTVALALAENIRTVDDFDRCKIRFVYPSTIEVPEAKGVAPPIVAIPTTLSAGEYTWFAGVTDEVNKVKDLYLAKSMTAKAVILDADVTVDTPQWLWLSSGIRAVDHCVETLCSLDAHPFTDATASHALRMLNRYLRESRDDPADMVARTQLQIASWMAFCAVANVNLGLSHGIGHQLGARCGVPHGVTSCVMLHNVLRFNLEATRERQAFVAELMALPGEAPTNAADAVLGLVQYLGQPYRLRDVGVKKEDFPVLAEDAMADMIVATNPRRVNSMSEVIGLLETAY
ncbi:MAG TPA: iron-containing alcohol dehydrogenase [Bauldia sp.]|nr:iron-containing alcohol dehydrogenase [Bauldia sp.]